MMKECFKLAVRKPDAGVERFEALLGTKTAQKIRAYHKTFPMYEPTPLVSLADTAKLMDVAGLYVKDESKRFGLNAFKVLGGSYAIGSYLAGLLGKDISEVSCASLCSEETRAKLGDMTFITATDGNHGRGVAWTATQFGMKSVVYMPKGSAAERLNNIRAAGAYAEITDVNYDDTVRLANAQAQKNGWVVVQDTSWEGYEEIPMHIMQGYCTMALEAYEQLPEKPTHIFLQAGVGSMAGAVAGLFALAYGKESPIITIVEPNKADCMYRTALANDGALHAVTGDMDTIMAGLACGEPCPLAWEVLSSSAEFFLSCPDYAAAKGMRMLASPAGKDEGIVSGESGASAFGCVAEILMNPELADIRAQLRLDENSRILFFSTEGATDTENYRAIVWDGKYPAKK